MSSSVWCLFGHKKYIKRNPERLECKRCGWCKVVHQEKERNEGNGWRNKEYPHGLPD